MSKFTFRLETMLKLRERQRDLCLARMQQAEHAVSVLEQQSKVLHEQAIDMVSQAADAASPGDINVDMLVEYKRFGMVLRAQLHQLAQQKEQVQKEADRRRKELTEADREVKVLEKLKEKQQAEHSQKEHYAEVKQLDEIAQRSGVKRN